MAKRNKGKQNLPRSNKYLRLLSDELREEITGQPVITELSRGQRKKLDEAYELRPISICWGIPMDEIMYAKFFSNWMYLNRMPWDSVATTESTYLPDARNDIHSRFVKDMDAPYLMMLDSDILAPPNIVDILLGHQKHLVGGWYKNKQYGGKAHPIVYDFVEETETRLGFRHRKEPGEGLEKVDGMGAGCWLMSRELAEALGERPYSMEKATEDLVLSKKVMDLGYDMYVDWSMSCAHVGVKWT